jgi:hypothetical protein
MLRLSLLVVIACALVSAGCSGSDAPKKKGGPTTQAAPAEAVRNA